MSCRYSCWHKQHIPLVLFIKLKFSGFVCGGLVTNAPMLDPTLRYPGGRLGRIQEGGGGGGRLSSPPARAPSPTRRSSSPTRRCSSPTPPNGTRHSSPPVRGSSSLGVAQPLRYVSEKARQFESGLLHPDKTDLYRWDTPTASNQSIYWRTKWVFFTLTRSAFDFSALQGVNFGSFGSKLAR